MKLAPATALQALARFQVLLADLFTSSWSTLSAKSSTTAFSAMEEVRKSRPSTLNELKAVVEAFAESVDQEEVKRTARSTWKRARACKTVAGASFKGSLEKILRGLEQYNIKMSHKIGSRNDPENQF